MADTTKPNYRPDVEETVQSSCKRDNTSSPVIQRPKASPRNTSGLPKSSQSRPPLPKKGPKKKTNDNPKVSNNSDNKHTSSSQAANHTKLFDDNDSSDSNIINVTDSKIDNVYKQKGTVDCPCGTSKLNISKIDCSRCSQLWHVDCVTLDGVSSTSMSKMLNYLCPFCYVPPVPIPSSPDICHTCINTATVRDLSQWSAINTLSSKLESFKALSENLSQIRDFDLHIQHLLLNKDSFKEYEGRMAAIESSIAVLNNKIDTLNNAATTETMEILPESIRSSISQMEQKLGLFNDRLDTLNTTLNTQSSENKPDATDTILAKIDSILLAAEKVAHEPQPTVKSHTVPKDVPKVEHSEVTVFLNRDEYISTATEAKLTEFLSKCDFTSEGGREVRSYGEPYTYTGSKSHTEDMPEVIKELQDVLNTEFCAEGNKIVSCLINKLSGPLSTIAWHSDDEPSIAPDSSIFTISIGDTGTVRFKDKRNGETCSEHVCKSRSLYAMTRRSQEFFKHAILPGEIQGVRYSLTFRCVSWRNRNSTIVIGDSNTGDLQFGDAKGTFGKATPGKKVWAPTIDTINPLDSVGYSNVVTLCGINDIRHNNISSRSEVHSVFTSLKAKIEIISQVNPRAKIFVCPLLPTRITDINRKVSYFNSLLVNDLLSSNFNVSIVPGFRDFADQSGLLTTKYCRRRGDALHLNNNSGVHILANKIKTAIFDRKKRRNGAVTSGRPYSGAVHEDPSTHIV